LIFLINKERREIILRYKNDPLTEDNESSRKKAEIIAVEYLDKWHPQWEK